MTTVASIGSSRLVVVLESLMVAILVIISFRLRRTFRDLFPFCNFSTLAHMVIESRNAKVGYTREHCIELRMTANLHNVSFQALESTPGPTQDLFQAPYTFSSQKVVKQCMGMFAQGIEKQISWIHQLDRRKPKGCFPTFVDDISSKHVMLTTVGTTN
jgi:hypothetical protein